MQNNTKTETRLAFIQFIFSSLFSEYVIENSVSEFENYFYKLTISPIGQKKELVINFNKNYFKKLTLNYIEFINKNNISNIINPLINFNRKFENWDIINRSIILSILSELEITNKDKVKILLNDYLNISKLFVPKKELSMINAITDKYVTEKNLI
jgi:transcription termination factor NusB